MPHEFKVASECKSAVRSHERGKCEKEYGTTIFGKTAVHSDVSSPSASGTCEKLATTSLSSQPEQR